MEREAIQDLLDSLDLQLASGRIDLETYQTLTRKWRDRLTQSAGPAEPAPTAAAAVAVVCPECSAPLEDTTVAPGTVVRCPYCRATFTLQRAEEKTERVSHELQRWLEQMMVDAGTGSAVDAASRAFIFGEKLGPALQLEYRRAMEPYEDVHEHPLVCLSLLEPLAGYRPSDHVLVHRSNGLGKVRELNVKVNSPLMASFALAGGDRGKLSELNLGTTNLVHLANVAQLLNEPSPEAYSAAKENLVALSKQYAADLSSGQQGGHAQFLAALRARFDANARVLDVMATVFAPSADFSVQPYLEELLAAHEQLQEAGRLAETSGYNPLAVVPLRTGIERDEKTLSLLQALLRAYQAVSRGRSLVFAGFYSDLRNLLVTLCPHVSDATEYYHVVEQVTTTIRGQRGEEVLRLIGGWERAEKQAKDGARRGMFGGGETLASQSAYWHPFWYAAIQYSVAKGTFFVSGVEQLGYGLLDGLAGNAKVELVLNDGALLPALTHAICAPRSGDGHAALPPLVSQARAEQAIVQAARGMPNLRNVKVRVEGLVYIPAVSAHYQSRSGSRQALYSDPLQVSDAAVPLLANTRWFFERYA